MVKAVIPVGRRCQTCKLPKPIIEFIVPGTYSKRCNGCRQRRIADRRRKREDQARWARDKKRRKHAKQTRKAEFGPNGKWAGYTDRNQVLVELGYADYNQYQASPLWKKIRAKVFAVKGRGCWLCDQQAICIHHIDYAKDTLLGRSLDGLVPLCNTCHGVVEFLPDKKKRSLRASQRTYKALLTQAKHLGIRSRVDL